MSQTRRPSNQNRPRVSRPGATGLRFGMFAVCVTRDPDPGLNKGKAKPLYDLLVSFADVSSRDTEKGYPYREALAACLDCTKQTVDRAADYLEKVVGLVTVHRRKVEGKPDENDANLYEIHDAWLIHGVEPPAKTPPQLVARYGHTVPGLDVAAWIGEHAPSFDLSAWRAAYEVELRAQESRREEQRRKERARRKRSQKGGGVMDDATPKKGDSEGGSVMCDATGGVTEDATGGGMGDALSRAGSPEPSSRDDAPSARSAPDGRRPTTGSRERGSGGSAASSKTKPSPLTPAEKALYAGVLAALPPELAALVPKNAPRELQRAVVDALDHDGPAERTAQQLVTYRLLPKWDKYYSSRDQAGALVRPVGVLRAMLKRNAECGDPRCDERVNVDDGEVCASCAMKATDRRADRERAEQQPGGRAPGIPSPRPPAPVVGAERGTCRGGDCGTRILLVGPALKDGLCPACRREREREGVCV